MEEMIARWIRETIVEYERTKANQNVLRMHQMRVLRDALLELRDKLLNSLT